MIKIWNKLTKKQEALIPRLYSTENISLEDKKVYAKFFLGEFTWYILEFDGKDTMFGLVVSSMTPRGEFGYISYNELKSIKSGFVQVDREIHQVNPREPKKLSIMLKEDRVR